ncbi:hypothetical protein DFO73_109131 [Cytobacillus oceanisediminis]|jgi:N-acetylglutamate synthase-like GNAT family acetyltransferase|uniref:Uncharacterized protein n=1 Tax=Cytobacillus oceanisediminis TaxID=665099 RepID=A0A2V2ZRH8_9BACI|nr:hypothetical protein [Cytobacillus oceanisediminis]PWW26965.1 hypothetical protein DFO73_109131 [Cytobacillus oceanisediminis]
MNLKAGNVDQFGGFSQFRNLQEFNTHLEMWLALHKDNFSKGELVGLKRLARFAAKIPGVSNAKIGTVLKAIHEDYNGNGISRSTFKRMIAKAAELGIFTVHETERKNGSQSSNLYVFNRFPKSEPPKEEKMDHHNKTSNLSKAIKNQENTKRNETGLDYTFTSDRVPKSFVDIVKYFFPEGKNIEEFWRMTKIAAYRNNRDQHQLLDTAIHSFKQLIRKMKSSFVAKPIAYFYCILNKKLEELYFEELFEMGFTAGNENFCMNFFYKR